MITQRAPNMITIATRPPFYAAGLGVNYGVTNGTGGTSTAGSPVGLLFLITKAS